MPPLAYTDGPGDHRPGGIAQAHDGDIQGAAAEIEDEGVLRPVEGFFIIQGSGYRLELEIHLAETCQVGRLAQGILRLAVLFGVL